MDYVEKESFGGSSKMFMAAQESPKLGCAWLSLGVINKWRPFKRGSEIATPIDGMINPHMIKKKINGTTVWPEPIWKK